MSKDQGIKRLLSPESRDFVLTNQDDKRRRNDSIEIVDSQSLQSKAMEDFPEFKPTLRDLKKTMDNTVESEDIKDLATKHDLKVMDDRICAQGQEISQLRGELKIIQGNVASLQSTVDGQLAENIAKQAGSMGREPGSANSNMADRGVNKPRTPTLQQRSLVFEGLNGQVVDCDRGYDLFK